MQRGTVSCPPMPKETKYEKLLRQRHEARRRYEEKHREKRNQKRRELRKGAKL